MATSSWLREMSLITFSKKNRRRREARRLRKADGDGAASVVAE
jgi:hypothetical protein